MNFRTLWPLLLLLMTPIILRWLTLRNHVWHSRLMTLGLMGTGKRYRIYVPLAILLLVIFALARPYNGTQEVLYTGKGNDVVIALDVSQSMRARDVKPSRLEFARRKSLDLVQHLFERSPNSRVGVVLFSGEAYLFSPLTADQEVLKTYLRSAQPELISAPGSSLMGAVSTAVSALSTSGASNTSVIILTDGEDRELPIENIQGLLKRAHAQIHIVGVGTEEGAHIQLPNGSYIRDDTGELVTSKLNTTQLQALVEGIGTFHIGALGDQDITEILSYALSNEGTQTQRRAIVYNEYGFIFLTFALLLMCALPFTSYTRHLLPVVFVMAYTSIAMADTRRTGEALYHKGAFKEAEKKFEEAVAHDPSDSKSLQAFASSQYRNGDYEGAAKSFEKFVAQNPKQFEGHYNLGNAYLFSKRYQEAIDAYDEALSIKPNDIRAQTNREIARQQLEKQAEPTPTPEASPSSAPSPTNSPNDKEEQKQKEHNDKNQDSDTNPTPSPSSSPQDGKNQQATPTPEQQNKQGGPSTPNIPPSPATHPTMRSPSQQEADQLLNALPDAPLLLRRKKGENGQSSSQTW